MRAPEERSGNLAKPDIRIRGAEIGRTLCERRAAHDHRYARAAGTGARSESTGIGQGLQKRTDLHEDPDRTRFEIAAARVERVVFHEYSGESRRRSAGRPRFVPVEGSEQVVSARVYSARQSLSGFVPERLP